MLRFGTVVILAAIAAPLSAAPIGGIEENLSGLARPVLTHCKKHGYKTVGILKFAVQTSADGKRSMNAGALNEGIADWLENALIYHGTEKYGVRLVTNATATAFKADRNSTLSNEAGRLKLFEHKYKLVEGGETKVDAFLFGFVMVGYDLQGQLAPGSTSVHIFSFDQRAPAQSLDVAKVETKTTRSTLADAGKGFRFGSKNWKQPNASGDLMDELTGGLLKVAAKTDPPSPMPKIIDEPATPKVGDNLPPPPTPPVAPPPAVTTPKVEGKPKPPEPVRPQPQIYTPELRGDDVVLTVCYNGEPVSAQVFSDSVGVSTTANQLRIATPQLETQVTLILENRSKTEKYGVVLLVNGKNTLEEELEESPIRDSRWILAPNTKYTIRGFHFDGRLKPFVVAPPTGPLPEFAPREALGLITMHVIGEGNGPGETDLLADARGGKGLRSFAGAKGNSNSAKALADHLSKGPKKSKNLILANNEVQPAEKLDSDSLKRPVYIETRIFRYFDFQSN